MIKIHAKTWIFWVQAIFFGWFGLFGIVFGPLFFFDIIKSNNGQPGLVPGIVLTIIGSVFMIVGILAVFNIIARSKPIILLFNGHIEITTIGGTSLDEVPMVPGIIRLAWSILSGHGFRKRTFRIPCKMVTSVVVVGLPMNKTMVIEYADIRADGRETLREIQFNEAAFHDRIHVVAAIIEDYCRAEAGEL